MVGIYSLLPDWSDQAARYSERAIDIDNSKNWRIKPISFSVNEVSVKSIKIELIMSWLASFMEISTISCPAYIYYNRTTYYIYI